MSQFGRTFTNSGPGGFVQSLTTDDGHVVTPLAGTIILHGTHGLNTTGTVGPNTATIAINNAITLGDLVALGPGVGALTAITGDIIVTAGNIDMPNTNSAGTAGVYEVGGFTFMHSGGPVNGGVGPDNVFLGGSAGAVGTLSAFNVGIGRQALQNAGSDSNVGVGILSCANISGGSGLNTAVGAQSLFALATGTNCIALGNEAGRSFTGAESNNIDIGNIGVLGESGVTRIGTNAVQTECFIAGIDGVNVGSVATVVTEAGDQLGTAVITAGSGISVTPGANTITIAATGGTPTSFQSYVGANINDVTGDSTLYTVIYDTTLFNVGGGYDTTTGLFTAPATGTYNLGAWILASGFDASHTAQLLYIMTPSGQFVVNSLAPFVCFNPSFNQGGFGGSILITLNMGDTVHVAYQVFGATKIVDIVSTSGGLFGSYFYGYQVA